NNYINDPKNAAKPSSADKKTKLTDITDGTSNTVLVGHGNIKVDEYKLDAKVTLSSNIFTGGTAGTCRSGNNGVANPTGVTLLRDGNKAPTIGSWGGPFAQGALIAFGDGSVRLIDYGFESFAAILTPSGGEVVNLP